LGTLISINFLFFNQLSIK